MPDFFSNFESINSLPTWLLLFCVFIIFVRHWKYIDRFFSDLLKRVDHKKKDKFLKKVNSKFNGRGFAIEISASEKLSENKIKLEEIDDIEFYTIPYANIKRSTYKIINEAIILPILSKLKIRIRKIEKHLPGLEKSCQVALIKTLLKDMGLLKWFTFTGNLKKEFQSDKNLKIKDEKIETTFEKLRFYFDQLPKTLSLDDRLLFIALCEFLWNIETTIIASELK